MNIFFTKFFGKLLKKAINKSVDDAVTDPVLPEAESVTLPEGNSNKALLKFIIQTLINILAAVLTALGATSCVTHIF